MKPDDIEDAERWLEYWTSKNRDPRWFVALVTTGLDKGVISEWRQDGKVKFSETITSRELRETVEKEAMRLYRLYSGDPFYTGGENT